MSPAPKIPSLSPSRSNDFMQCPLLFRFRTVDKLPEPPSKAAAKGTLVHSVLEYLYDIERPNRTVEAALDLMPRALNALNARQPDLDEAFSGPEEKTAWLGEARGLVERYFSIEDPTRLEPAERETHISAVIGDDLRIKGIIDRVDVTPDGAVRIVDYKSGKSPKPQYSHSAAFQMRFYAVAMRASRGITPKMLQLVYLGDGQVLRNEPTEAELDVATEKIISIWDDVRRSAEREEWRPKTSRLCDWCHFQPICPAFGGTPPELEPGKSQKVWLAPPTLFSATENDTATDGQA